MNTSDGKVRYLTFAHFDTTYSSDVLCLTDYEYENASKKFCQLLIEPKKDIAIVPKKSFLDKEVQKKILSLARENKLYDDYGVTSFCSEITLAGYLFNKFHNKIINKTEYYKTRSAFYDMYLILQKIHYAKFFDGFGIFEELHKDGYYIKDYQTIEKNDKITKYAKTASTSIKNIKQNYEIAVYSLLFGYESIIKEYFSKIVSNETSKKDLCECMLRDNFLYSYVIKILPKFKFNEDYKSLFANELCDISNKSKKLFNAIDSSENYFLSKWFYDSEVIFDRMDLIHAIVCVLKKFFNKIENDKLDYDIIFDYFNYHLLPVINSSIVNWYSKISRVFCYSYLKYEFINNEEIREILIKFYSNFSGELKKKYSDDNIVTPDDILKKIFFSSDSLLGINKEDSNQFRVIANIFLKIDYNKILSKIDNIIIEQSKIISLDDFDKFNINSYDNIDGQLFIANNKKLHRYHCHFIKNESMAKQDKFFDTDASVDIYYDKFYLYIKCKDGSFFEFFYNSIFSNIDIAVFVLMLFLLKAKKS